MKDGHHKKHSQHKHLSGKERREKEKRLTGIIRTTGKGMGFVEIEGQEDDIVIEPDFLNTALNGDEVEIILAGQYWDAKRSKNIRATEKTKPRQAGQVVKILRRAKKEFVGEIIHEKGRYWLKPDDRKVYVTILLVEGASMPEPGTKALVKIIRWEKNEQFPTGEIVKILGKKGDHEAEIQSIILDRGIDTNFPPEVDQEAEDIRRRGLELEKELPQRKDFRDTLTFTIDPVDAKDFDDAISLKDLGNGKFEIGVHIADVSHYVREGTALDREARERATSIYLVDRTIPMLPEVLSNDLCSLNPNVDRFAFSAVFVMSADGIVHERWFGKTIINSNKRFSYETAQETLDKKSGEHFKELDILNQIAKKLQKEKYHKGAIDFEAEEVRFKLDENFKPIDVYKKARLDTHKLVEEFMLLANREVAKFIYDHQKDSSIQASIYRIHDLPDQERIEDLALFIQALGYHLPVKQGKVSSQDINKLLKALEGKPEESMIKTATIRSMSKAIYSTKNIGHYGLAFEYYTHFTSPIRRYPDLVVHRVLQGILEHDTKKIRDEVSQLERISRHSTDKEIAAAEAERASIKFKQVEYMSERVGQDFNGIISGVTEWGIYIEEERTKCEGMAALRDLGGDYFVFNKRTYSVKGEKTKKEYRLGDKVRFRVMKADLDAKTLDYKIL